MTDQIESLEKSSEEIEVKLKRARHLQKATAKRHQLSLEDLSDISRLMENQKSWRHLQLRMYGSVILTSLLLSDGPTGCHLLFWRSQRFVCCLSDIFNSHKSIDVSL